MVKDYTSRYIADMDSKKEVDFIAENRQANPHLLVWGWKRKKTTCGMGPPVRRAQVWIYRFDLSVAKDNSTSERKVLHCRRM